MDRQFRAGAARIGTFIAKTRGLAMYLALIIVGGACLFGAAMVGLARLRRQAVAPATAAVIGLLLVILGIVGWPGQHAKPVSITVTVTATPPAPATPPPTAAPHVTTAPAPTTPPAAAVDDPSCKAFIPGSAPRTAGLVHSAPGDVQRIPIQMTSPGPPAGGPLVRSGDYPFDNPGYFDGTMVRAIMPALTDFTTADFDDPTIPVAGAGPFLRIAVGTPRPGTCWAELTSTALTSDGGSGVHTEPPGRRMSAYHLTVMCGWMAGGYRTCAWSGPGIDGHHPLFGILYVWPGDGRPLSEAIMTTFSEKVFELITPS